jgi:hypothetical protein
VAVPISALYVGLCAFTPISIYADAALDDQLFLSNGQYLAAGYWLGPFGQTTLAKGPGYPLFLAVSAWSGLPITISQGIFKCIAVGALAWVVKRLTGSSILSWIIFILTLWNPGLVLHGMVRETIYPGQTLLLIAVLTYALFCAARQAPAILWGSIAGLILGWFWLTREEGVWILPAVAILILGACFRRWSSSRSVRLPTTAVVSMLCLFAAAMLTFHLLNFIAYGSFVGVDFQESNFVGAVQALERVRVGKPVPFLPVPKQVRLKVYQVSPAFASLEKYLDPAGAPIAQSGCRWYPWTCGDIAGGWFLWALRYAAGVAGHYNSPAAAAQFFGEIRDEVTSACQQKLLVCYAPGFGLVPHLNSDQLWQIPQCVWQGIEILLFNPPPPVIEAGSSGNPAQVIDDWQFLNHPVRTPMVGATSEAGSEPHPFADWRVRWAVGTRSFLVKAYRIVMLPLFWIGLLALPLSALMMGARRAAVDPTLCLAAAMWVLVPSRLLLLAVIHVSSFPAMHFLYLSPAYPLITIAPLLSIWSATDQLRLRYGRKLFPGLSMSEI